ncbi:MAG: YceI family protein, partial [Candidatus Kapaibacterium sp.]
MYKLLIAFVLFAAVNLTAGEYHVDTGKDNLVKFISDAPVEEFEGVTDKIDGYLLAAGLDKLEGANFYFEVDMNSVDTGIGLRNRHMREDYIHTEKYPYTYYKGKIVEAAKQKGLSYKVKVDGVFFIHGVEKERVIEGIIKKNNSG